MAVIAAAVVVVLVTVHSRGSLPGLHVQGNRLVYGGRRVQLRGVSRSGTEYRCVQGNGIFDSPDPSAGDTPAMIGALKGWDTDVVRVPLNEDCWLGINVPRRNSGAVYRQAIVDYVDGLKAAHLFVILDLHTVAPGDTRATAGLPMADADHAPAFWRSVARTFKPDHALIFDLFNEPNSISWSCWRNGCQIPAGHGYPGYRAAGMQQLVDAVRATGATQPLMLGGLHWALDASGWLAHEPHDPLGQLIASVHTYGGAGGTAPCPQSCLNVAARVARQVPTVFGELGENDCGQSYVNRIMRFADAHGIGYLGWAWDATSAGGWTCAGGPALITDYAGDPTPYGSALKTHFRARGEPVQP